MRVDLVEEFEHGADIDLTESVGGNNRDLVDDFFAERLVGDTFLAPACLQKLAVQSSEDQHYQAPLVLYYFEDLSYKEIAEVLDIPLGTVQSRIARGKMHLHLLLTGETGPQKI